MNKYFPVSDLHLEFLDINQIIQLANEVNNIETENLCLCGDICSLSETYIPRLYDFLDLILDYFQKVFYIPGNHEYYGTTWESEYLKKVFIKIKSYSSKLVFAPRPSIYKNGEDRVLLSTLWYPSIPDTYIYRDNISDFKSIEGFNPYEAAGVFERTKVLIDAEKPNIWLFHHLPSYLSVPKEYRSSLLNCYYVGNIEDKIRTYQPDYIFHGHTHQKTKYRLGKTKIICNPKGYFYEQNSIYFV